MHYHSRRQGPGPFHLREMHRHSKSVATVGVYWCLAALAVSCTGDPAQPPDGSPIRAVEAAAVTLVEDISDAGNGSDVEVSFDPPLDETGIAEYRIVIVLQSDSVLNTPRRLAQSDHFTPVQPTGAGHVVRLGPGSADHRGTLLRTERDYRAVVVSVADGVMGTSPAVSEPSLVFRLWDNGDSPEGCEGWADPESSEYVLPFPEGARYRVYQGNCSPWPGGHSVQNPGQIRYAYDFSMPLGTEVAAIRSGVVTFVREDQPNFGTEANLFVVRHEDGTQAVYGHLSPDGVIVSAGERVEQGQIIALSGGAGIFPEGYQHLHIQVDMCEAASQCSSVPISFRNALPADVPLKPGRAYAAGSH